jgi:hypothetical protein
MSRDDEYDYLFKGKEKKRERETPLEGQFQGDCSSIFFGFYIQPLNNNYISL